MLSDGAALRLLRNWDIVQLATRRRLKDVFGMRFHQTDPTYLEIFQDLDPTLRDLNSSRKNAEATFLWFSIEDKVLS